LRKIRTGSRSPGDHPWLGAFRRALTREDLATLTVRGYERAKNAQRSKTVKFRLEGYADWSSGAAVKVRFRKSGA
jgi:hypothetical protein